MCVCVCVNLALQLYSVMPLGYGISELLYSVKCAMWWLCRGQKAEDRDAAQGHEGHGPVDGDLDL